MLRVGFVFDDKELAMASERETAKISLDVWAVLLAFVLALAVKFGALPQISW